MSEPEDSFQTYAGLAAIMFFIGTVMTFAYHEFEAIFGERSVLQKKTRELEQENFISRYEALKNQVNPHFLFNSLNVLSGLIYEDVRKSDQFIRKFSEVFRYVLEHNDANLTTLSRELAFLDSYMFLQQIRYGDNVHMHLNIDADYLKWQLPPMSLQIVFENVFKHNQIGPENPVTIHISVEHAVLVVKNNYFPRKNDQRSTGIGQTNLLKRYELVNASLKLPQFYLQDEHYVVELPLISTDK